MIRQIQRKIDISKKEIAEMLNVTPQSIHHYDKKIRYMNVPKIQDLILALKDRNVHITFEELFPLADRIKEKNKSKKTL